MPYYKTKLYELLEIRPEFSSVLYDNGIFFGEFPEESTLGTVCNRVGLDVEKLLKMLEAQSGLNEFHSTASLLDESPVELVISYLQHMHRLFLTKRLPHFLKIVDHLTINKIGMPSWTEDLKIVFPIFAEDFFSHIKEEETTIFNRIYRLLELRSSKISQLPKDHESRLSLSSLAHDHKDEDEMKGIRQLTENYCSTPSYPLEVKVLLANLQMFDHELQLHAKIEDKVLFPKALHLEEEVTSKVAYLSALN